MFLIFFDTLGLFFSVIFLFFITVIILLLLLCTYQSILYQLLLHFGDLIEESIAHIRLEILTFRVQSRVRRDFCDLIDGTLRVPDEGPVNFEELSIGQVNDFQPIWIVIGRVGVRI